MTRVPDELVTRLAPPAPPSGLRQRTLTAAAQAMAHGPRPDIWMRLRDSGTARVGWAVAVACLLFGHLVIGGGTAARPTEAAVPLASAVSADSELAGVAALPRLTVDLPGFELGSDPTGKPRERGGSEEHS